MINELSGRYRPFSNFWTVHVLFENEWYPSVENAYQAAKMKNLWDRSRFFYCKSSEAKNLGRLLPMRDDWEEVKLEIMHQLVLQKFKDNDYLRHLLFETANAEIQEGNWWGDTYWGTVNGKGENHLGKILMQVRDELRG